MRITRYCRWRLAKKKARNTIFTKPQTFRQALTVGVGTVMDAKEVLVLITGANKAFALYKVYFKHWCHDDINDVFTKA